MLPPPYWVRRIPLQDDPLPLPYSVQRLVLDFSGMSQGTITERIEVNQGAVSYIQPVYFAEAEVLRVEIALNAAAAYDIQKPDDNQLAIKFSELV